jgi:Uma2 family endonuclease
MDLASEKLPITLDYVHRFSLEEYIRLIESGGFDEDTRVELLEGFIVDMSPRTREHELAVEWLTRWLATNCDWDRFRLRPGSALTFERSQPEPDFALVPHDAPAPYHPRTASLVARSVELPPLDVGELMAAAYA